MSEKIFDNPYLAEIQRQEGLIRYCWQTAKEFDFLANQNRAKARRALNQIEAAKVRALQHTLREQGLELCAAHPKTPRDNLGLVQASDTAYLYDLWFWPVIKSPGVWVPRQEHEIRVVCIDHIPDNPNRLICWDQEFPMQRPGTRWYVQLYQQIQETHSNQNIHSLLTQRAGQWVRDLDGVALGQTPIFRLYPSELFTHFDLPQPDPEKMNLVEPKGRIFYSTIDDPDTEVNYTNQEPWEKLFN